MTARPGGLAVVGIPVSGPRDLGEAELGIIGRATVVAGGRRHLAALAEAGLIEPGPVDAGRIEPGRIDAGRQVAGPPAQPRAHRTIEIGADLDKAIDEIAAARTAGEQVVVAATGDPGFFGVGRLLAERFGPAGVEVRPAASSVAVAFGRLGLPWDDAVVASAHGRSLEAAVASVRRAPKAAILTSPDNPPEAVCAALAGAAGPGTTGAVLTDLGGDAELVAQGPLDRLAAGTYPPLGIVIVVRGGAVSQLPALAWEGQPTGRPALGGAAFGSDESDFEHRDGMITKPEVRAVCLARLELPAAGVLWDVGAGSGSLGIEAAGLAPGLNVYAIERNPDDAGRIRRNAARHHARLVVVTGEAPGAFEELPDPDRAVVGGGGIAVLDSVLARLQPGGRVVATFAAVARAAAAAERLGSLAQVAVNRGRPLPDGTLRLVAADPVFVCWGPA